MKMMNFHVASSTYLPALGMNQIFLEHGEADQECVLLLGLYLSQVTPEVLTELLALSPGEASGWKGLLILTFTYVSVLLTCVMKIEASL